MTYVIAAPCVADYSCVDICPVDCIAPHPSSEAFDDAEQLYINPAVCVSCGACVGACPVGAIFRHDELPDRWHHYISVNAEHFAEAAS